MDSLRTITRRHFFRDAGLGIGAAALSTLVRRDLCAQDLRPRVKSVIYLFMAGAPSHLDLLDPKPELKARSGRRVPEEFLRGERFAFILNDQFGKRGHPLLLGSPFEFRRCGKSGLEISELLPHLGSVADDIAVVRSMHTTQFNHGPAQIFMNSGHAQIGRPSMGSWLSYGIGSENRDLPAFIVLLSGDRNPDGGKSCWGSGFLPTRHQGVEFRTHAEPVLFLSNPKDVTPRSRRAALDALGDLNGMRLEETGDPEISTRIAAYEMAFRMQTSVPELMDLSGESEETRSLYGVQPGKPSFGANCLLARRLVERGVRFIQLYHRGWDHHGNQAGHDILEGVPALARETDQGAAALVKDLKRRGLLDETLVVWGGEFGRTPMNEEKHGSKYLGRDHHARAFSVWMAGGGIPGGRVVGRTDDLGYNVVEDPVSVHDLHATILHLLGLDHTKLVYRFQGRDFRLTDVHGKVIGKLFA